MFGTLFLDKRVRGREGEEEKKSKGGENKLLKVPQILLLKSCPHCKRNKIKAYSFRQTNLFCDALPSLQIVHHRRGHGVNRR